MNTYVVTIRNQDVCQLANLANKLVELETNILFKELVNTPGWLDVLKNMRNYPLEIDQKEKDVKKCLAKTLTTKDPGDADIMIPIGGLYRTVAKENTMVETLYTKDILSIKPKSDTCFISCLIFSDNLPALLSTEKSNTRYKSILETERLVNSFLSGPSSRNDTEEAYITIWCESGVKTENSIKDLLKITDIWSEHLKKLGFDPSHVGNSFEIRVKKAID